MKEMAREAEISRKFQYINEIGSAARSPEMI
jgi:hypothetical protein